MKDHRTYISMEKIKFSLQSIILMLYYIIIYSCSYYSFILKPNRAAIPLTEVQNLTETPSFLEINLARSY